MVQNNLTVLILTFNEAANLQRTLEGVRWARDILIIDSFSTDATLAIARNFSQVRILQRAFDSFAGQCNFGLESIQSEWVLSLDADYVLPESLGQEIHKLQPTEDTAGYQARFRYCIGGRPLRGSLYPPRTLLYRRRLAHYKDDGHGHRVAVQGPVRQLSTAVDHDDRKPLTRWFAAQDRYALQEAQKLLQAAPGSLRPQDRLRLWILPAPFLVLAYTLVIKGAILDGWPGWMYALQRLTAEVMLSMRLIEARLPRRT